MAEKKKYNSILISGRKDETLTYSKYVKDEESGESVKESLDKKVNVTDELTTQQIKDGAITNEKMAADSVGNSNLQNGSVSNEKLEDGSITNEKLAENSITKDKLQDKTIGVEKLDNELRQTIAAATGLPEHLVETIQNVDDKLKDHQSQLDDKQSQIDDKQRQITANDEDISLLQTRSNQMEETIQNVDDKLKDHQSQLDDKQSQIDDKQRQITANDEDISLLQTRSNQMEETIKSIAATGGASQATSVTYNNEKSKLTAINIQSAVDEVVDKTAIKDEEGTVVETPFRYIQNEEFIFAKVDAEDRLLFGIQWDGTPVFGKTSAVEDRLQEQVTILAERVATIMGDEDTTNVIDNMNELKKFFAEIENTETLTGILANLDNVAKNLDKTTIKDEEGNVQDTPFRVIENDEFIMAVVDSDDKVLFGIYRATGKPYYPQNDMYHISQSEEFLWVILDAANHPLLGIQQDGTCWAAKAHWLDDIKAIKEALSNIDKTLKTFQLKEDGKGLINLDVADSFFYISNDEYIIAVVDAENRILAGIKYDGQPYFPNHEIYSVIANEEWLYAIIDAKDKVLCGFRADDGHMVVGGIDVSTFISNVIVNVADIKERTAHLSTIENDEYLSVDTDAEGKVIGYIAPDGSHYLYKVKSETIPTEFSHIEDIEERMEITKDAEGKILGYRDKDGIRHEHKISLNHIELSDDAVEEIGNYLNDNKSESDILSLYPKRTELPILANFRYKPSDYEGYVARQFTLLWFSDIHSVGRRLERIMRYKNQYSTYLFDAVATGDQNHNWDIDYSFWKKAGASGVLAVMGNHEGQGRRYYELTEEDRSNNIVSKYTNTDASRSAKELYTKYIQPYLADTNIVFNENKAYYYKDYEEMKIRIIALDEFHWNNNIPCKKEYEDGHTETYYETTYPNGDVVDTGEQEVWFKATLEDARKKGLHVICMTHTPDVDTKIDCTFSNLDIPAMHASVVFEKFAKIVDDFMGEHSDSYGKGNFICWLTGDRHCDQIAYRSEYPKQLVLVMETSGSRKGDEGSLYEFTGQYDRIENTKSDDLFNILAIDTSHKLISIHRVGADMDNHGRGVHNLLISYDSLKVLFNN